MIPSIRGTHDILPGEVEKWQHVERVARDLCDRYGYVEVRTPVIEREELFAKGTGATTDIVQKEMYTFADKGGERSIDPAQHGLRGNKSKWMSDLKGDCPNRDHPQMRQRCDLICPDLPKVL